MDVTPRLITLSCTAATVIVAVCLLVIIIRLWCSGNGGLFDNALCDTLQPLQGQLGR